MRAQTTDAEIAALLHRHWDPIGCGVPADEYASYVDGVRRMVSWRGRMWVRVLLLTSYLNEVRTQSMCLPRAWYEDEDAARILARTVRP